MSDYCNGQIHGWNGGECPVHPHTVVSIWKRSGSMAWSGKAGNVCWDHGDCVSDIIAFQVVKAYVEPKVIWVNEYAGGKYGYSYENKEEALLHEDPSYVRIAVKYVEVRND